MSNCRDKEIQLACFKPSDGSKAININHTTVHDKDGIPIATYFSDRAGTVIDESIYLGGGIASLGACEITNEYEVYVVRLDGNVSGVSNAKIEGKSFVTGDIGNTFSIGTASLFPEYVSYSAIWFGDTEQDARLDWNDISYLAGVGSGTAGYLHSSLPELTDSNNGEIHQSPIILLAQSGAFVEFRFKVRK